MQNTVSSGAEGFHRCNHQKSYLSRFSLIGYEDGKTAQEFTSYITEAITEKVAIIFVCAHFIGILRDGSQTRKNGGDKEMVLVRTERNGNNYVIMRSEITELKRCRNQKIISFFLYVFLYFYVYISFYFKHSFIPP